jgi:hypothetical protein
MIAGLAVFVGLSLVAGAVYRQRGSPPQTSDVYRSTEHNYSIRLPGPPWKRDEELAKRLGGVLAFRLERPAAYVVFIVRDFPKAAPTAGELRESLVARLRLFPITNLRFEDKTAGATFGGRSANRLVFQGEIDKTPVSGDVHYLTHEGKAYWLVRWCPAAEVEKVAGGLADLAARFALLDLRPDWHPELQLFSGVAARYTLTGEGDRWSKAPYPPQNYDPAADLALVARVSDGSTSARAQLLVLLLPSGGDPIDVAKSHLLARQKEVYPGTKLVGLRDGPEGSIHDAVVLRVDNTPERSLFVVLRAVPLSSRVAVVLAECDFAKRDVWEDGFHKLLATFRPAE